MRESEVTSLYISSQNTKIGKNRFNFLETRHYILKSRGYMGFLGGASGKEPTCQCRTLKTWVQSLGQEDPLEEGMAAHSRIPVWRIPWTEEPGALQSIGSQRVKYD